MKNWHPRWDLTHTPHPHFAAWGALLCLSLAGPAAGLAAESGDDAFRKALAPLVDGKASSARIPPGIYRLGARDDGRAHVLLSGLTNATLDGTGVTLIATENHKAPIFVLERCRNLTIKGFTLDCDPMLFTQGVVVGFEGRRKWLDVKIEDGYPADVGVYQKRIARPMSILDPEGRIWKHGAPDVYYTAIEERGPGLWRMVTAERSTGEWPLSVGDLAAIPLSGSVGLTARACSNICYEGITVFQCGNMAFHEHGGDGGTRLLGCRVMRKPGTSRLLSSCADGFHCKNMRVGPLVMGCLFEGMHDDAINIHGMYAQVVAITNQTLYTVPAFEDNSQVGDSLEFFSRETGSSLGVARLTAVQRVGEADGSRRTQYGSAYGLLYAMTVSSPVPVTAGDRTFSLACGGRGFTLVSNEVRRSRYRGFLLRAQEGLVQGNRFFQTGHDAISITSHLFSEGPCPAHITVRDNDIFGVGAMPYAGGSVGAGIRVAVYNNLTKVLTKFKGENIHHITIASNRVHGVSADGIWLSQTRDSAVVGNNIQRIGFNPTYANSGRTFAGLRVEGGQGLRVGGNQVSHIAPGSSPFTNL